MARTLSDLARGDWAAGAAAPAPRPAACVAVRAAETMRAYAHDMRLFHAWCVARGLLSTDAAPETLAIYLRAMAAQGYRLSTIKRAYTGIAATLLERSPSVWARSRPHDVVAAVLWQIRRDAAFRRGTSPARV